MADVEFDTRTISNIILFDKDGNAVTVTNDAGILRLEINGKVSVVGASPPPFTTPVAIFADTPLIVGSDDTTFTVADGETFFLQQFDAGNADPTKGAVVEIYFDDGTEHLVDRSYTAGQTVPKGIGDVFTARDGTVMLGDSGGTSNVIVRRVKFSGTDIAIDVVVRGYSVVVV